MAADDARHRQVQRARRVIKWVLRGGLGLAVALMAVGLGLRLADGDLRTEGVSLLRLLGSPRRGDDVMALGVLVLAVVPPIRVASLLALWAHERDRRFVGVAVLVIAVLLLALAAGGG